MSDNQRKTMSKEELIELLAQQSKKFHPDYEHSIKLGFDIAVMMVKELLELEAENEST